MDARRLRLSDRLQKPDCHNSLNEDVYILHYATSIDHIPVFILVYFGSQMLKRCWLALIIFLYIRQVNALVRTRRG